MLNSLLDMTPGVNPVYDERIMDTVWALVAVIILLVIISFVFLILFLYYKFNGNKKANDIKQTHFTLSTDELNLIDKYKKLKDSDKNTLNQMLNSLDNSSLNKE